MFRGNLRCDSIKWFRNLITGALVVLAACFLGLVTAQLILCDFGNGNADGWPSSTMPINTTTAAFKGKHSLATLPNQSDTGDANIELTQVVPGATFPITGYVVLTGRATTPPISWT
jgi:hypothetical protein